MLLENLFTIISVAAVALAAFSNFNDQAELPVPHLDARSSVNTVLLAIHNHLKSVALLLSAILIMLGIIADRVHQP